MLNARPCRMNLRWSGAISTPRLRDRKVYTHGTEVVGPPGFERGLTAPSRQV